MLQIHCKVWIDDGGSYGTACGFGWSFIAAHAPAGCFNPIEMESPQEEASCSPFCSYL